MSASSAIPGGISSGRCQDCGAPYGDSVVSCGTCKKPIRHVAGMFRAGEKIDGKYDVIQLLGAGGMGEVYQVRHALLGAIRCIKVMKQQYLADESFRNRFLREAIVATHVYHHNVAIAYDFATLSDGSYYMVSEYIDGITIRQWISRNGPFPLALTVDIALQVLTGLEHCHKRGLLHRDISPDNVMVSNGPGGELTAKIIDLGIAKIVTTDISSVGEGTQVGMFVGNPKYSSPEQLGALPDGEEIDARADLYCLGGVIFEMITGAPPFRATSAHGYAIKHLTETPPKPSAINPSINIPEEFERVILRALQKDRSFRFPDTSAFAGALAPFRNYEDDVRSQVTRNELTSFLRQGTEATAQVQVSLTSTPTVSDVEPPLSETEELSAVEQATTPQPEFQDPEILALSAFEEASRIDSTSAYRDFVAKFPHSTQAEHAKKKIDERLAFRKAEALDTEEGWEEYLAAFETEPRAREARASIERLRQIESDAWARAEKADTAEAWRSFIAEFPESRRMERAENRLQEIRDFELAEKEGRPQLESFLRKYSSGSRSALAREALERIVVREAFEKAARENSPASWRSFLAEYKSGNLVSEAKKRLESVYAHLRNEALERKDPAAVEQLLHQFPDAPDRAKLENARLEWIDDAIEKKVRDALKRRDVSSAAQQIPSIQSADRRRRLELTLNDLLDQIDWETSSRDGSLESIEGYLKKRPSGRFAAEAKSQQLVITTRAAIARAEETKDEETLQQIAKTSSLDSLREEAAKARKRVAKKLAADEERRLTGEIEKAEHENDMGALERIVGSDSIKADQAASALAALRRVRATLKRREEDASMEAVTLAERRLDVETLQDVLRENEGREAVEPAAREALGRVQEMLRRREVEAALAAIAEAERRLDLEALEAALRSSGGHKEVEAAARESLDRVKTAIERREREQTINAIAEAERREDREAVERLRDSRDSSEIRSAADAAIDRLDTRRREQEEREWRSALKKGTAAAFESFLGAHEASSYAEDARSRLAEMKAFAEATAEDSVVAWQSYLSSWGSSDNARKAKSKLQAARKAEARREASQKAAQDLVSPDKAETVIQKVLDGRIVEVPAVGQGATIVRKLPWLPSKQRAIIAAAAGIVIVVLVIVGVWLRPSSTVEQRPDTPPPVAIPTGVLIVDARPWGRIDSIMDTSGKDWSTEDTRFTPAFLSLPPGQYNVRVSNENFPGKEATLEVSVTESATQNVVADIAALDAASYFTKAGLIP